MISKNKIQTEIKKVLDKAKPTASKYARKSREFAARRKQLTISLGILFLGIMFTILLVKMRRPPQKVATEVFTPLVKTARLKPRDIKMIITGYGTVSPKVQVEIVPQVSGKVVRVNPEFKSGGFIGAGQNIIEIDPRDYELAVQQALATVAEAKVKVDVEKAEAQVARKEWEQINPGTEPSSPLVLREPQIKQAEALLASAEAQLATAKLNLERTKVTLPLKIRVMSEKIDLGQYISVGQSIGSAYGVEAVEIELPLEDGELQWFDVPENSTGFDGREPVAKATVAYVKADFAGGKHVWKGYITRMMAEIDKKSRLVSVVIEVPQPFDNSDARPDLLPGMFVEVFIEGNVLKNAFAVPRYALHEGNKLWVVEGEQLRVKELEIVRFDADYAYTTSSLDGSATIVVSSLDTATDGMKVRVKVKSQDMNSIEE